MTPEADYLIKPAKAAGCRLIVNLHSAELSYDQWIPTTVRYHQLGVDGYSIWDTNPTQPTQWALFKALGHIDEIAGGAPAPPTSPSVLQLTDLGDFVMDRYKSSWCF